MTVQPLSPLMLEAIERDLKIAVSPAQSQFSDSLEAMIRHHMGWIEGEQPSGKRIRPLLLLLTCHAAGSDWEPALPAASAIEIIHNFTLIHDDIEDDSETRRGRPTVWKIWGVPQAINTGDAMFALARVTTKRLAEYGYSAEIVLDVETELDRALLNLTVGQHLDIHFEGEDQVSVDAYMDMIEGKTAALLRASTSIGAILSYRDQETVDLLAKFGMHLGLAFQITDDILGIWGDPIITGKPAGDDLLMGKKSLPVIYGLAESPSFKSLWTQKEDRDDNLETMIDLLETCGSKQHALKQADEHTRSALEALAAALPEQPSNQELYALANRLLVREY